MRLTFSGGHTIDVIASMYFELKLAEDAAHNLHAVGEGLEDIYKRAKQSWEHLSRKHKLEV